MRIVSVLGVIALAAASGCDGSSPTLTRRGSTPCPPASGEVETWCDDAGSCEFRVGAARYEECFPPAP